MTPIQRATAKWRSLSVLARSELLSLLREDAAAHASAVNDEPVEAFKGSHRRKAKALKAAFALLEAIEPNRERR